MKILLINAPWYKDGLYGVRAGSRWPHFEHEPENAGDQRPYMPFPFYMAYAASMLQKTDHQVFVIDAIALGLKENDFLKKVNDIGPDIIVQEVASSSIEIDLHYSQVIKQKVINTKIVYCGPNSLMQDISFLKDNQQIDFIIYGEYEEILCKLIDQLNQKKINLKEIDGLIYRDQQEVIKNKPADLIKDIDAIPWPARELFPMENYIDTVGGLPLPSLQVWASRGCPFKCNFCLWPQLMYHGRNYRIRNPKDVADEIEHCVKKYNFKSFYFDDDTFNIGKDRILQLTEEINKKRLNIPFAVMARADKMDEEQLVALKKAGLFSLKYGVESGEQELVNNCGKNLDLKKVEEIVALTKSLDIKVHLTFTFGLPGETLETIDKTIDFAKKLDPDTVQFSIMTPFPGSQYYQELDQKGYILSKNWEDYTGYTKAVIRTDNLSSKDLENALRKANRAWRIHLFEKNKEFNALKLNKDIQNLDKEKIKNIYFIYSSFKEHIDLIMNEFKSENYLDRSNIIATCNNFDEIKKQYDLKIIHLKSDMYGAEELKKADFFQSGDLIVVPMNNTLGLGYEDLKSYLSSLKEIEYMMIDTSGDLTK